MSFSPDGETLVSGSWDNSIKLWNLDCYSEIKTYSDHSCEVNGVCFSPDGKTFASGSWDRTIKVWKVIPENEIQKLSNSHNSKDKHSNLTTTCSYM